MSKGDFTFDAKSAASEALVRLCEAARDELVQSDETRWIVPAVALVAIGLEIDAMPSRVEQGPETFSSEVSVDGTLFDLARQVFVGDYTKADDPLVSRWNVPPKPAPKVEVEVEVDSDPNLGRHSRMVRAYVNGKKAGSFCPDCEIDVQIKEMIEGAIAIATA